MPHVLVAGTLHDCGLSVLRAAMGITLDYVPSPEVSDYRARLGSAEALLIRTQPLRAEMISEAPHLKIVSRHGVGTDSLDVNELTRRGIAVAIVGDVNARTVAEHAFMLMLAAARRLLRGDTMTRQGGNWTHRSSDADTDELAGGKLLIVGFGRIGRCLARMAQAFELKVIVYDPFQQPAIVIERGCTWAPDLLPALADADYVSLHAPLSERPILGAAEFAVMKASSIVVNTARGGLIDERALVEALTKGKIAAAGLDVFCEEPPPRDHPLLALDQVILTPHAAALTRSCVQRMAEKSARNILDFFSGTLDPALVVNAAEIGFQHA